MYDPECHNLAEHFLTGENLGDKEQEALASLAQAVQTCVEDWIKYDLPQIMNGLGIVRGPSSVGEAIGEDRTEVSQLFDAEGKEVNVSVKVVPSSSFPRPHDEGFEE